MKKVLILLLVCVFQQEMVQAQVLKTAIVNMQPTEEPYLSIRNRKAYTDSGAISVKKDLDLAMLFIKDVSGSRIEWYNMTGRDSTIRPELRGTATLVNAISFDRQQFDKCKTVQDLHRMTGHLTTNSFSHFAVLADGKTCTVTNRCFVVRTEKGKKALLWVEESLGCSYKVIVKTEP